MASPAFKEFRRVALQDLVGSRVKSSCRLLGTSLPRLDIFSVPEFQFLKIQNHSVSQSCVSQNSYQLPVRGKTQHQIQNQHVEL